MVNIQRAQGRCRRATMTLHNIVGTADVEDGYSFDAWLSTYNTKGLVDE